MGYISVVEILVDFNGRLVEGTAWGFSFWYLGERPEPKSLRIRLTFFILFLTDVVQGVWIEFWRLIRHSDCQLQITYFTLHHTCSCISNCD